MADRWRPLRAVVLSLALAAVAAMLLTTGGLAAGAGGSSTVSAPSSATPGSPFAVTFAFVDAHGSPFPPDVLITFFQSSSAAASGSTAGGAVTAILVATVALATRAAHAVLAERAPCEAAFSPTSALTGPGGAVSTSVTLPGGCPEPFAVCGREPGGGSLCATVLESGAPRLPVPAGIPAWCWPVLLVLTGAAGTASATRDMVRRQRG